MGLEQNEEQQYREVVDKYIDSTVSVQMKNYDFVVRPNSAAPLTLTLPPVAEAKGRCYSILNRGAAAAVIADKNDSEGWTADINLSHDDHITLFSDGLTWWPLNNTGAAVTVAPTTRGGTTEAPTTAPG